MAKFELGKTVMTRGFLSLFNDYPLGEQLGASVEAQKLIHRHHSGDWGDLGEEDKKMNDEAVRTGEDRILSTYQVRGEKVYVITEEDRSATTILLASDY